MAVGSNINPNFPVPGIDQSSKGFRDNFSAIKIEIEAIQAKNIVLVGDATGNAIIDGGTGDVVINTVVNTGNIAAGGVDRAIQFNNLGSLDGSANLIWDPAWVLTVGNQLPDPYYWLDADYTKIHNELLLQGDYGYAMLTISDIDSATPDMIIRVDPYAANISINDSSPLSFIMAGNVETVMTAQGISIGRGAAPRAQLDVLETSQYNVAVFTSNVAHADAVVRLETEQATSTIGLLLQQTAVNRAGGMRMGVTGNLTLHTGLNNGAWLDDSSAVVTVDTQGQMGIGINDPQARLDVDGGIQWNQPNTANVAAQSAGVIGIVVDQWSTLVYRSADYMVQVTDGSGNIEVTRLLVMHQGGSLHQFIYANVNAAGVNQFGPTTLGTLFTAFNGSAVQLIYSGDYPGNVVRVTGTYIPI